MFFNTSSNYLQSAYYVAPQPSHLQPFQEASCQAVCEKVISSIDDSQSAQQLQYDSDDLFFNHHELPSHHNEDSYFGSHISCDQIHDQDDDDLHGLFPMEFTSQVSQQFSYPVQQSAPIASYLNESSANNKNIPVSYSNTQGMTYYQNNNNSNTNQMVYQKMSSSSSVVPSSSSSAISTPQTYTFNNFKQQNNFYSSQQQQQQHQSYQQQQMGNNADQMNQQFQNSSASSSSSTTFSSSQSCSTLFSSQQKQSVSYVAPSPVNYYKLYENNNLVNQQQQQLNQVKGSNGNNRQCLQPSQQQIMFSQGQSSKPSSIMFQALNQQQSQTFYQQQQQQQQYQIPQFTQQYSYEEYSCGDHQASSILNFTENCGDDTTSDMHLNDEHHTLPIYGYAPQQSNTCENFEFFGHSKEEDNQEEVQQYQQQQSQQQEVSYSQCQQDAKNNQMNNNIPSMSSSHTLPISPCEAKHLSEDEEHESMEHHDHDDDDEEEDDGKIVSMEIIADNPDFYTETRKEEITDAMQKSNKKNVVRNLMRAFKQYFLNRKTSEQIMKCFFPGQNGKDVQQKFKRYFSQRKFNHHSIKQLVQHEKYGAVFHQFLKEHSLSYLKNSSVKMQELHQVFIDFLLLCFKDIDLLDHLETYSKIKNPFQ